VAETFRLPSCAERSAPTSVRIVVFPDPDGPGEDHDLARLHRERDVVEDLLAERAAPEVMAHAVEDDERLGRHQKISAGSAARSFRIAMRPETQHMTTVRPSTAGRALAERRIGSMVADCVTP
jgi:hypothetical protein